MTRPVGPLSEAQLQIMKIIWARREASVAQVWQALSADRPVARNTVHTMVARLEERGWLKRRAAGNAFIYSAAVPQRNAIGRMLRRLVDTVFNGSADGLVLTLLEERGLSKDEADRIRQLIDRAEKSKRR